jgi:hypothetical protein
MENKQHRVIYEHQPPKYWDTGRKSLLSLFHPNTKTNGGKFDAQLSKNGWVIIRKKNVAHVEHYHQGIFLKLHLYVEHYSPQYMGIICEFKLLTFAHVQQSTLNPANVREFNNFIVWLVKWLVNFDEGVLSLGYAESIKS